MLDLKACMRIAPLVKPNDINGSGSIHNMVVCKSWKLRYAGNVTKGLVQKNTAFILARDPGFIALIVADLDEKSLIVGVVELLLLLRRGSGIQRKLLQEGIFVFHKPP